MAKKKRWIPFDLMPGSWGLSGKTKEIARAEYYYDGDELEYQLLEIEHNVDSKEYAELKLKLDYKKEKIGKFEYEKELATLKKEPYVNVLSMGIDPDNVVQGYFELDWNDEFVKMLHNAGMTGTSDEDIVNKWFNGVCRTVLLQESADLDYGLTDEQNRR